MFAVQVMFVCFVQPSDRSGTNLGDGSPEPKDLAVLNQAQNTPSYLVICTTDSIDTCSKGLILAFGFLFFA